ncbi:MAG: hypothetical protein J5940_05285, partial [Clostridia bacterium]|nr:hypothetical protein [Clostridia bacterium]
MSHLTMSFSSISIEPFVPFISMRRGYPGKAQTVQVMTPGAPQGYYDGSNWKGSIEQDGGVLMNQGIHGVDLMCGFLGRPKVLSAAVKTLEKNIEADDAVTAAVEYPC